MKWVPTSLRSDEIDQDHGFRLGKIYCEFNECRYTEVLNIKNKYWTAMRPGLHYLALYSLLNPYKSLYSLLKPYVAS